MKQRFKQIRIKMNCTQAQFADMLDTNPQSITDIESGRKKPNENLLEKLHTKLSVNLNWLICGTGKMQEIFPSKAYILGEPEACYGSDSNLKDMLIESLKDQVQILKADNERLKKFCEENGKQI